MKRVPLPRTEGNRRLTLCRPLTMPKKTITVLLLALLAAGCASRQARMPPPAGRIPPERGAGSAEMRHRMLAAHNAWRQKVRVPPLAWSEPLARYAQTWADTLRRRGCEPEHRPDSDYGENIEWAGGHNLTPEEVVELWGREERFFNYGANSCGAGKNCLHYTQLVWRRTTAVGCGAARCDDSEVWVCNYAPAGNWVGEKPY